MTASPVIALDAMGGDKAPDIVIAGAALAFERYPKSRFIFVGDEKQVKALLEQYPALRAASELRHTSEVIAADLKPSLALRQGRHSSMRMAIDAVAKGEASQNARSAIAQSGGRAYSLNAAVCIHRFPRILHFRDAALQRNALSVG